MVGRVVKLRTKADRLRSAEGDTLRQMVLDFAAGRRLSERAVGEIIASIDRQTASANGWTFVMISADANDAVVEWLFAHAERPHIAVRLWMKCFKHLRHDTGEIVQSRDELAASVGTNAGEVSRVMSQLEEIGAISRWRDGRSVRYVMSPRAGTHLTGVARTKAQTKAPALKLALVPSR